MKKSTQIAVLVAIACILVGCAIAMTALAIADFDFVKLSTDTQLTNTYPITEDITSFDIRTAASDIVFAPSPDGTFSVECLETDKTVHTVEVVGGTLKIRETNTRKWYENIGIFYYDAKVTVYIPSNENVRIFNRLSLTASSGNITLESSSYKFTDAELHTSSGNICYRAEASRTLTATTSSGDIQAGGYPMGTAQFKTTSGDIHLTDMSGSYVSTSASSGNMTAEHVQTLNLDINTTSGDVELYDSASGALTVHTSSGNISLHHTNIRTTTQLNATSGEIWLDQFDAETLSIKTSSGNVIGYLRTPKNFIVYTSSGSVQVPPSVPLAGNCEIRTSSGDVRIDIPS